MDNTELYEVDTVIVTEDDGTETEYAVLDKFDFDGKKYAVMAEVTDGEVGDDEFLFIYEEEDNDLIISSIESDEEFDRVSAYYDSLCPEEA